MFRLIALPIHDLDNIVQSLYLNHRMSSLQIAPMLGTSKQSVLRSLERSGIPRRENKEANRLYSLDEGFFNSIDTAVKAYWLGFITADGCVYHNRRGSQRTLALTLQGRDKPHLEQLAKDIKAETIVRDVNNAGRPAADLRLYSQRLTLDLERLGVTPKEIVDLESTT